MFDLIALAYQADLTRVASHHGRGRHHPNLQPSVFRILPSVSHHANDLERINKLVKIQTWHLGSSRIR
jgi:hypothetical protein